MNTLSISFPMNSEQSNYVSQLNSEHSIIRTQQSITVEKFRQMLRNNGNDSVATFLTQVLKEGLFNNDKHVKQNIKISWQRMTATFYNDKIGMVIERNNVTIRSLKADETINLKGKIVDKKSVEKSEPVPEKESGDHTIQDINNLKASIAKGDDTIDALQVEIDGHIKDNNEQADTIDERDATIKEMKARIEQLEKEKTASEKNYRQVVAWIESTMTRKELRERVAV